LWLDTQLYGLLPHLFRLENLLFHSINAFLVYRFTFAILEKNLWVRKQAIARTGGVFFAVMACHSEAVIWIACRADLLATFFSLICLISYLKWLKNPDKKQLLIYTLSLGCALLSKESAFALPILLAALTVWQLNHLSIQKKLVRLRWMVIISLCVLMAQFILRYVFSGAWIGHEKVSIGASQYLVNFLHYSYRALLFPLTMTRDNLALAAYAPYLPILVLGGAMFVCKIPPYRTLAILLLVLFVGALSPVLHKTISLDALQMERYLYLPSVFLCVLLALALDRIGSHVLRYSITMGYVLLMVIFLNLSIQKWKEAGEIARKSLQEVKQQLTAEKIFVLGLPISYGGIDIFRNGFPRAVMFFNSTDIRRKFIYMPINGVINEKDVFLSLAETEEGFYVTAEPGTAILMPGVDLAVYDVHAESPHSVHVHYPEMLKKDYQVFIYCGDQLRLYENCKRY